MDEAQVRALMQELESPEERVRLRAANAFVGATGDDLEIAVPALRTLYAGDPNPAVKFLAKKALTDMGVEVEAAAPPAEVLAGASVLKDHRVLWKIAQDALKHATEAALKLIYSPSEVVQGRVVFALSQLGSAISAGPLIQAFLSRKTSAPPGGDEAGEPDELEQDLEEIIRVARLKSSRIDPTTAAAMGNLKVPEVFGVLVDMLRSGDPVIAPGAVSIMEELDDPQVIEPLLLVLGRGDGALDPRILETLEVLSGHDALRPLLLERLHEKAGTSTIPRSRLMALRALGRLQDPASLELLREALQDNLPAIRATAAWAMASYDMPAEWLASNLRQLLVDSHPACAAAAASTMLGTTAQDHAKKVVDTLQQGPVETRVHLAMALGRANRVEAGDYLEALLRDPDARVSRAAQAGVREITDPDAADFLGSLLSDEDPDVAVAAVERVGSLGLDQYNDMLLLFLDEVSSPRLLATMLHALGRLKIPENVPTIGHYLGHEDARVRANGIEALEVLNDPRAMSLVNLSLSDPDGRVRANAARALWGWGEVRVVRVIEELLGGDPGEQASGCDALGRMAGMIKGEDSVAERPMLAAAMRQSHRYPELKKLAGL